MPETTDSVTSVRIVSVDYYLAPPLAPFDVAYSEFRGASVKRVPVLRIFGSTAEGEKVCAHVHGVFPYLYIPMDEETEAGQFAYQITHALDRALSVTQGRVSSTAQHVFKAVPVRGKPFYGYHARDHLYLKVYFYNPSMMKRAANLLQNGAICGRVFQAHESHVPYILQFFIDYNLYGMSFLHIGTHHVVHRPEEKRMATTQLELDLPASEILNRTTLKVSSGGEHQNPGIAAIWEDELRRRKTMNAEDLPPIEVPESQERPNAAPTDSDRMFREILRRKLMSEDSDKSILGGESVQSGRKFDLSVILSNSVYPASCPRGKRLPQASMVPDHVFGRITPIDEGEKSFLDSSLVDESVILSLESRSQTLNQTLDEEDLQLLAIMEQLEEGEGRQVDLDSSLAPLSQPSETVLKRLTQEKCDEDLDEDLFNEFNETMDFVEAIPQLDGEHEVQKQSPTRLLKKGNNSFASPKKSTRSPKKNHYAPLDLIITSPSGKKRRRSETVTPVKFKSILKTPSSGPPNGHASDPPKKKLKFDNIVIVNGCFTQSLDFTPKRQHKELDEQRGFRKSYAGLMAKHGIKGCEVRVTRVDVEEFIGGVRKKPPDLEEEFKEIINRSPMVSVARLEMEDISKLSGVEEEEEEVEKKNPEKVRSSNDKAHMYDVEHNFFPVAGPSNVNYYNVTDIPLEYYGDVEEEGMNSFYEMTMCLDSTDDELSAFAREQEAILTDVMGSSEETEAKEVDEPVGIYPLQSPPKPADVRGAMHQFGIEEHVYHQPFFSDPLDGAERREVGPMVLQVKGNALSICEEFISCLEDLEGLSKWRQRKFQNEMGEFVEGRSSVNIKEFMATEKSEIIEPQTSPPTAQDARTWLKVREKVTERITMESVEVDSPVKVKREKQKMVGGEDEECNGKVHSLSFKSDPFSEESQVIEASPSDAGVKGDKMSLKKRLSYSTRRMTRRCQMRNGHGDEMNSSEKLVKCSRLRNNNVKRRTL